MESCRKDKYQNCMQYYVETNHDFVFEDTLDETVEQMMEMDEVPQGTEFLDGPGTEVAEDQESGVTDTEEEDDDDNDDDDNDNGGAAQKGGRAKAPPKEETPTEDFFSLLWGCLNNFGLKINICPQPFISISFPYRTSRMWMKFSPRFFEPMGR